MYERSRKPARLFVLPAGWREIRSSILNTRTYMQHTHEIAAIVGEELHEDGWWIHLSVSGRNRLPSHQELQEAKDLFIGRDRKAVQVFPPNSEHINIHLHTLHLWSPCDHNPLPDFRVVLEDGTYGL